MKLSPRAPPARRAEAGEIVLRRLHVAGVGEIAGLKQHLEEGVVPAELQRLTMAHVLGRDDVELRIEIGIALLDVGISRPGVAQAGTGLASLILTAGSSPANDAVPITRNGTLANMPTNNDLDRQVMGHPISFYAAPKAPNNPNNGS